MDNRQGRLARLLVLAGAALWMMLALAPHGWAQEAVAYGFAKASPLTVYDKPDLGTGRSQVFEFGRAYEIIEKTAKYVLLKDKDQKPVYVKPAHVLVVPTPDYVTTTSAYRITDRNMISLWQSSSMLGEFLTGGGAGGAQWDYREIVAAAPNYDLKLPVFARDTLELLDGARQVEIAGVLMPVSRRMADAFTAALEGPSSKLHVHFLLDVSGSTDGFLEPALERIVRALSSNDDIKRMISSVDVTTFGMLGTEKAAYAGTMDLDRIIKANWRDTRGVPPRGESEPLALAMHTLLEGISSQAKAGEEGQTVVIVLSGADVDQSNAATGSGRVITASLTGLDAGPLRDGLAIFAQVTPEPGPGLKEASSAVPGLNGQYLEFSSDIGDRVARQLTGALQQNKDSEKDPKEFAEVAKVAAAEKMMAFLPRRLKADASLPRPQNFAEGSDWYAVPLWVPLDGIILKPSE